MINGNDLISWGFKPGAWFKNALALADKMDRENHFSGTQHTIEDIREAIMKIVPVEPVYISKQDISTVPIHYNIDTETDYEKINLEKVKFHMEELARVPTICALSVMPDACPSGHQAGTIPVGGVAVAKNAIHPGMHSSDVCCSVAASYFPSNADPVKIMDAGMKLSHFGKGYRQYSHDMQISSDLLNRFERNSFLGGTSGIASKAFATQGDGNHFFYVGRLDSTGQIVLVTHHGSRKPGADLYKKGIAAAVRLTSQICPSVESHNAWIPYDTQEGQDYWEALQLIRTWTKNSHFAIHDSVAKYLGLKIKNRHWNEHNFVFKRGNMFYHAKGATPNYAGFASDTLGQTLIPLNMAAPILVGHVNKDYEYATHLNAPSLGFAPHGAGRNFSRTEFQKTMAEKGLTPKKMIEDVLSKYDIRAYSGKHDISEFPLAYKNADQIIQSIRKFGLTDIVDMIHPLGSIMAGHDSFSYRKKDKKTE